MEPGQEGRSGRVRALDGVRGLAVVAVVLFHAFPEAVPGGFFGVEAFFVLSGFLLARVLLAEHRGTGTIDPGAFAVRRLRRVVPALWLLLAVLVVAAPLVARTDAHRLPGDVAWSGLGVTNWHLVAEHGSYFAQLGRPPLVRHLWSIAVELQFYLLCPFVVLWAARSRRRIALAGVATAIGGSAVLMAVLARGSDASRAYYGTDTRVGALLSGVLLALVLAHGETGALDRLRRIGDPLAVGGVATFAALCWLGREDLHGLYPLGFLAVQGATAAAIIGAVAGTASARALASTPLRWLGERSYGIYLWHWPLVALLRPGIDVSWPPVAAGLAGIAGAVVLGHLSYTLVERPLLSGLRVRLHLPGGARPVAVAASVLLVAGVAGVAGNLPGRDPIAEALRAGEQILSSQAISVPVAVVATTAPAAAPATTAVPAPTATAATVATDKARTAAAPARAPARTTAPTPAPVSAAPAAPLPPGPPPGSVSVTAIGDSVMLSAAGPLKARLGPSSSIDAKVSRQFREGVEIVASLRQQGRLAPVVVIHLGTNGPPTPGDVDAMMGAAGTSRVLLLTVRVNRDWSDETNAVLAAAPVRHPSAVLVDWNAHSGGHGEWFHSDGTHLTAGGAEAYAALIGSMLPAPPPPPPPTAAPTTPPPRGTTTTARR